MAAIGKAETTTGQCQGCFKDVTTNRTTLMPLPSKPPRVGDDEDVSHGACRRACYGRHCSLSSNVLSSLTSSPTAAIFCVTGTHARTHTAEEQNAVRHTFPQPLSVTWRCGAAPWRHGEIQTTTGCCDERQSAGAVNQFYIRSPFSHLVCLSSPAPRLAGPASDVPQAAAAASTAPESH